MYFERRQGIVLVVCFWMCSTNFCAAMTSTKKPVVPKCGDSSECSETAPACCGKKHFSQCRTRKKCVGVPCSSSFDCDNGRMWCCGNRCEDSACLLPVWAIVLIVIGVSIIISALLIYVILECCRRWPGVRRTIC